MSEKRITDAFRLSAAQVSFSDRGKGITSPNVQAAIEEMQEKLENIGDHLHRGEGENSVQLGPDSIALADSSIALGHNALARKDDEYNAENSVAIGASAGAHGESSVAIGDRADAIGNNDIAIGKTATAYGIEGEGDAIAIGNWTFADSRSIAIGSEALATRPYAIAIGAEWCQANDEHAIAMGTEAQANMPNTISIGGFSQANWNNAVAIGPFTESNDEGAIALGDSAMAHSEASISIGQNTMTWGGENIAIGKDAEAYSERSVAIGSGALALDDNSVAIGPGAIAEETNTIVLGTAEHVVIIPGNLDVLGRIIGGVTWFGPSDDVIAEIDNPIEVEWDEESSPPLFTEKQLTLKNPGRYRIKGTIYADEGSKATLSILDNTSGNPERIADLVVTTDQENFSVDFYWDIGVNTTLTFRLDASPLPGGEIVESGVVRVTQVKVCGAKIDIGNGVVGW